MKIEKPTAGWQRWFQAFNFSRKRISSGVEQ